LELIGDGITQAIFLTDMLLYVTLQLVTVRVKGFPGLLAGSDRKRQFEVGELLLSPAHLWRLLNEGRAERTSSQLSLSVATSSTRSTV
jgi:hypothetical protein